MNLKNYTLQNSSRQREDIEWSVSYSYNVSSNILPRVLLIGDSICNGYQNRVREMLDGRATLSFWASSKCVTDPDYLRELDFILDYMPYSLICFNNGLHSLYTDREEWITAYSSVLSFITQKLPNTLLSLTLNTPLKTAELTKISSELNCIVREEAKRLCLPIIDLFSPMDHLDRDQFWSDTYHFRPDAIQIQAEIIYSHVSERLKLL